MCQIFLSNFDEEKTEKNYIKVESGKTEREKKKERGGGEEKELFYILNIFYDIV
jgi:hypothetical protein